MAISIALSTTVVTRNLVTNKSINSPLNISFTTSGSGNFSATMPVTSSWSLIDQNQNKDFLFGTFTNQDTGSNIYIAVGNTSSVALTLTPNWVDTSTLAWSGSTNLYAKSSGPNPAPILDYTLISMN